MVGIDCVFRMNKKYYPQAYLNECKYQIRKNRMMIMTKEQNLHKDDLELSSSDESDYESCNEDEPNDNEE